ncbi:hypothetical protein ACRQFN_02285 [Actinotignum sp. GS-2025e]|uniref:hypothetical protein n=1 Tax=unclassified Actinotignum TaxID=2632702 RepID=UPI003F459890
MFKMERPWFVWTVADETPAGNGDTAPEGNDKAETKPEPTPKPEKVKTDNKFTYRDPNGNVWNGDELYNEMLQLRHEAAENRVTTKKNVADEARNEIVDKIATALGIKADKPPTVEELTAQVETASAKTAEAENRATASARELAVYKAARAAGADPDALLDSRGFVDTIQNIDPTDSDAIGKAIKDACEKNPRFKAAPQAGTAYRIPVSGTGSTAKNANEITLADAFAARMK